MLTNEYLKRVYDGLAQRNANEPEFLQAVREVLESIQPVVEKHPEYEKAGLIERLVEPERVISFRVPWVDDAGKVQALDEAVVGDAFGADGSVDALDPQLAEVALASLAVAEVVGKGVQQLLLGLTVQAGALAAVAGSPLENDATLLVGVYCALDTCHI